MAAIVGEEGRQVRLHVAHAAEDEVLGHQPLERLGVAGLDGADDGLLEGEEGTDVL